MKIAQIFSFFLTICLTTLISWTSAANRSVEIPFKLHSRLGKVTVSTTSNEDPNHWGFDILFEKKIPVEGIKGFPVCTAKVSYEGKGYQAIMGWIQFVTYTSDGNKTPHVILDLPPQLNDNKSPYAYWGHLPTLFDAPSMLSDDHSKKPGVDWKADSFLVASPDGLITKTVVPIASFSWGYKIGLDKKIKIIEPKDTQLVEWRKFSKILRTQFPHWNFKQ